MELHQTLMYFFFFSLNLLSAQFNAKCMLQPLETNCMCTMDFVNSADATLLLHYREVQQSIVLSTVRLSVAYHL